MTTKFFRAPLSAERDATTNEAAFVDFLAAVRGLSAPKTGPWAVLDWAANPALAAALRDFAGWNTALPVTLRDAIPTGPSPAVVLRLGGTRHVCTHNDLHAGTTPLEATLRAGLDDPLRSAARQLLDRDLRPDDRVLVFHTDAPSAAAMLISGCTLVLHDRQDIIGLVLEESITAIYGDAPPPLCRPAYAPFRNA